MLPARHFTRAILVRSLGIWLGVRAVVTAGNRALRDSTLPPEPLLELTAVAAVGVVVLVAGLVLLDAARRNELLFLANLGVGRGGNVSFTPILAAEAIGKSFGSRQILKSASLWLQPRTITVLVGRNGQGKSTLCKIACGLLSPDTASCGFAKSDSPAHGFRGWHGEVCSSCPSAPYTLSGGERRRAELAMAVARRPDCLLADEPFLGIMPRDAEKLSDVFRRLAAEGCAIGISGHEVSTLFDLADDVAWMTAGTTHALGNPAQARAHDQFCREYLGPGEFR